MEATAINPEERVLALLHRSLEALHAPQLAATLRDRYPLTAVEGRRQMVKVARARPKESEGKDGGREQTVAGVVREEGGRPGLPRRGDWKPITAPWVRGLSEGEGLASRPREE